MAKFNPISPPLHNLMNKSLLTHGPADDSLSFKSISTKINQQKVCKRKTLKSKRLYGTFSSLCYIFVLIHLAVSETYQRIFYKSFERFGFFV